MKSLFSENDIVLPEWLGILLEKVDRDTGFRNYLQNTRNIRLSAQREKNC